MSDKPDMAVIERFDKWKLKKTETHEKNPLPSKERSWLRKENSCAKRALEKTGEARAVISKLKRLSQEGPGKSRGKKEVSGALQGIRGPEETPVPKLL
ncbi:uncharacterized protein isoform X1 [Macaca fascicularis]|uniref:uncharacterized protein isoform X1 n=1 Tax=Macaca fascicularis TaxID=9541 RepID=UPI003D15B8DD